MKNPSLSLILLLAGFSISPAATLTYEFTGGPSAPGALTPTLVGVPAGVSVSNLAIGSGFSDLSGGTDALRFDQADTQGSTGTAITNQAYLSFSVTMDSATLVNLTSFTVIYNTTIPSAAYSNARLFSTIQGFDQVTGDTIGVVGKQGTDAAGPGTSVLNLATPSSNSLKGANVNDGDFDNLTDQTVTFYIPWVDNGAGTFYTDVDSIQLGFDVVPEPSTATFCLLGVLACGVRRRRMGKDRA